MSIHADPMFIRAEVDRRLELYGVSDRRYAARPAAAARSRSARRPGAARRLLLAGIQALGPSRRTAPRRGATTVPPTTAPANGAAVRPSSAGAPPQPCGAGLVR
jgi:hypothetical protein